MYERSGAHFSEVRRGARCEGEDRLESMLGELRRRDVYLHHLP
jgi:hypothetical protein